MTIEHLELCTRLQRLGFTQGSQMKLYGEVFEFTSEPMVMTDELIMVDATEKKTGQTRRVRIPLPIVKIAGQRTAA